MSEQPEALRLAKWCDDMAAPPHSASKATYFQSTAAELRRQHSRIEADEALMRTNLEVLETALDTANEVATSIRITYAGYMNHRQKAADAEVEKIDAAITALRTRLDAPVQGGEG